MDERIDLRSLPLESLRHALVDGMGEKPFRVRQVYRWLHQRGARSFDEMTDLSKDLRARLAERYRLDTLEPAEIHASRDGTVKFRFVTGSGSSVESVYIPEWRDRADDDVAPDRPPDRQTLCISSQVGCAMGCAFCFTGTMGLVKNLTTGEIVDQVHRVNRWLIEERGLAGPRPLSNIVFMGMGEPLHNYEPVRDAVGILLSEDGPNFSNRHVTVSTSGLVPQIRRLGEETDVKLAVSLTGTTDPDRDRLMPVNRRWPLEELMQALRDFPMRQGRRITFEYVLLRGVTDTVDDADRLARLVRGIPAKINLIAYNEGSDEDSLGFRRSDPGRVDAFRQRLTDHGLTAVVRRSRGRDIAAACGQLAVEEGRRSREEGAEATPEAASVALDGGIC